MLERGRNEDEIENQYSQTVRPMYDKYVYPNKKYADLIIGIGGNDQKTNKNVIDIINSLINN